MPLAAIKVRAWMCSAGRADRAVLVLQLQEEVLGHKVCGPHKQQGLKSKCGWELPCALGMQSRRQTANSMSNCTNSAL